MINSSNSYVCNKNIVWNPYRINRKNREFLHKHHAMVLWFTGLSGSGKSTIASVLEEKLYSIGISTYVLDGDNIRYGLCNDLSFNNDDRYENIRRVGEVARLMFDAGLVVLTAFISPHIIERRKIRSMFFKNCFLEIFIDTPIAICKKRDPKGLYKKVISGEIKNFTGIDSLYEIPEYPDIYLDGTKNISELVNYLFNLIIPKILYKKC